VTANPRPLGPYRALFLMQYLLRHGHLAAARLQGDGSWLVMRTADSPVIHLRDGEDATDFAVDVLLALRAAPAAAA